MLSFGRKKGNRINRMVAGGKTPISLPLSEQDNTDRDLKAVVPAAKPLACLSQTFGRVLQKSVNSGFATRVSFFDFYNNISLFLMNLFDLLSDDTPADGVANPLEMQHYLDTANGGARSGAKTYPESRSLDVMGEKGHDVVYLPAMMSNFQKDVCELVVQIFREGLEQELRKNKNRTSISNLSNDSDELLGPKNQELARESTASIINLMYEQLRRVSMHPSLLVDHFIPKRWLLLEVNERLLNLSGKLALFDSIVELLCDSFHEDSLRGSYNMLVMAESVKELEWIEGTIIGKKISYKNLSTRKLYDLDDTKNESKDDFNEDELFAADRRNKRHHYVRRRKSRANESKLNGLVLHLATSRYIYESYTSSVQFDMIFSFDSQPDLESASMQLIRGNNLVSSVSLHSEQFKTPIVVPIPMYSIEHFSILLPRPEVEWDMRSGPEAQVKWKLKVISAFVANRHKLFETDDNDFFVEHYGEGHGNLKQWLLQWWKVSPPPSTSAIEESRDALQLHPSEDKLIKRLLENLADYLKAAFSSEGHRFKFESPFFDNSDKVIKDFETFKRKLAVALNQRDELVEAIVCQGLFEVLPGYREAETGRQNEIDACEEQMAEKYRKLRKLNEDASLMDRKYNRAEAEFSKAETTHKETKEMLQHLEEVIKDKSEDEIKTLIEEQHKVISQLNEERDRLDKDMAQVASEGEALRETYQSKSSEAVSATVKLTSAQKEFETLDGTFNGPGMHILPSLKRKYEQVSYDIRASKLQKESQFLKLLFLSYLDKQVKDMTAVVDSTSAGLSSRPTNRISRGSTPFT